MQYKEMTAKEARELSRKGKLKDLIEHEQLMAQYRKQVYLSIEKEAEAGRFLTHVVFPRKKKYANQVVEQIRDDLQKQGYDIILQKGIFNQLLSISW